MHNTNSVQYHGLIPCSCKVGKSRKIQINTIIGIFICKSQKLTVAHNFSTITQTIDLNMWKKQRISKHSNNNEHYLNYNSVIASPNWTYTWRSRRISFCEVGTCWHIGWGQSFEFHFFLHMDDIQMVRVQGKWPAGNSKISQSRWSLQFILCNLVWVHKHKFKQLYNS